MSDLLIHFFSVPNFKDKSSFFNKSLLKIKKTKCCLINLIKMTALILKTNDFEPILLTKALDSWVWDTDGKKYLDCVSGTWTCNLGHKHPKIIQAMKEQIDAIIHRCMRFHTPTTLEAAEQVLSFLPAKYDKITFLNSGSEAMEFEISFCLEYSP